MTLRKILGFWLAGSFLWVNANACWMPADQCQVKETPPCHAPADSAPTHGACCGRVHLVAADMNAAVVVPAADRSFLGWALPAASPAPLAIPTLAAILRSPGPPLHSPPFLPRPHGRSPPLA
jgi:hypothetical protein